jgi:hypothetical protein
VQTVTLALGGLFTIAGALGLVTAYRHGQQGRREDERRWFRASVVGLAVGSALFLVTVVLAG